MVNELPDTPKELSCLYLLYIMLNLRTSSRASRIELALCSMQATLPQQQDDMLSRYDQIATTHHAKLETVFQQSLSIMQRQLSEQQQQMNQISTQNQAILERVLGPETGTTSNLTTGSETSSDTPAQLPQSHEDGSRALFSNRSQHRLSYQRTLVTSFSLTKPWKCQDSCHCSCHTRRRITTPNWVKNVFGALLMNYTGCLVFEPACCKKSCKSHTPRSIEITYYFPTWVIARVICLIVGTPRMGNPTFGLVLRRSIPFSAEPHFFHLAWRGNSEEIASLLESGQVQLNDLEEAHGKTALTVFHLGLHKSRYVAIFSANFLSTRSKPFKLIQSNFYSLQEQICILRISGECMYLESVSVVIPCQYRCRRYFAGLQPNMHRGQYS